ncbi:hypothetical protein R1flu_014620 [Riccia fluitans]|uniref:Uncharacterized protein n=1 Tax=Riccia fluitans TaxID=41844 RepID=A0ABD1YJZ1_9MARC
MAVVYMHQPKQGDAIGFKVDYELAEPLSDSIEDKEAAERCRAFQLGCGAGGWILHGGKLLLRGSADFFGLSHYTTRWVVSQPVPSDPAQSNYWMDQGILTTVCNTSDRCTWCFCCCEDGVLIGMDDFHDEKLSISQFLEETRRVNYHLKHVHKAIEKEADVRTYFTAWTLMDSFEWAVGYESRSGLYYVDNKIRSGIRRTRRSRLASFSNLKSTILSLRLDVVDSPLNPSVFTNWKRSHSEVGLEDKKN